MSLRRPTVALSSFTFDISPLYDVAQTSDCGTLVIYFQYKPFLWCRSNVRLWHACCLFSIKALSAMSPRRLTVARLSFSFQYKPFMWCRLDARLRHDFSYFVYLLRRPSRHPIGFQLFVLLIMSCKSLLLEWALLFCSWRIHACIVISLVRTVLRVLSKYSPGLLIWPDVDEGDLMDEEFDSESDA